ncbi:MAG: threonine synthase, partial [Neisseriaceae bacterium]|nr:threonine synthase [Neisseriaceae bacterium]
METALATKFEKTIYEAVGEEVRIPRPDALADLEQRPQRVMVIPNSEAIVKTIIREKIDK